VVYRDRHGRELSRVDQVSNVTYVAKSPISLGAVDRARPSRSLRANDGAPGAIPVDRLPIGCESAVSVTADPELARTPSRCIS
jgi:hypothetical protein